MTLLYFLNATITSLKLEDIYVTDGHVLRFYSNTIDKIEHQLKINGVEASNIAINLTPQSLGKFLVCVFYCHSTESGKSPAVYLSNIKVRNIFYNKIHMRHQVLRFDNAIMKAENISGFNISNGMFFTHNPLTATSDLFINNMSLFNPPGFALVRILDCGIVYFTKAEILNSYFTSAEINFNKAAGFNLAQTLIINNVTFDLFQESGTILFAQVSKMSSVFINNLNVKSWPGSFATLVSIVTEIQDLTFSLKEISSFEEEIAKAKTLFGIRNSKFTTAFDSAFVLLVQTQLLFVNCEFEKVSGIEGGVMKLSQNSRAILYNCRISDAKAKTMGGSFSIENSALYLIRVSLSYSVSFIRGGVINAVDSTIYLINSSFLNASSGVGGVIFGDSSLIFGSDCLFKHSLAKKYGGHIVLKQGLLNYL